MTEIKVNASFTLLGGVLPAEPPCSKKGKKKKKEENIKNEVLYRQESIRLKNQTLVINLREPKPVQQILHLSKDAYEYMISDENPVSGLSTFIWKRLNKNKRLKEHLKIIAEDLNAKLDSFVILED